MILLQDEEYNEAIGEFKKTRATMVANTKEEAATQSSQLVFQNNSLYRICLAFKVVVRGAAKAEESKIERAEDRAPGVGPEQPPQDTIVATLVSPELKHQSQVFTDE